MQHNPSSQSSGAPKITPGTNTQSNNSGSELGWGSQVPPSGPWGQSSRQGSGSSDIVVDSHDKEAWPSIGDNSETGSTVDDVETASAKSGSVISSSSNPGQSGLGDSLNTAQGNQSQASSLWGSSFGTAESDKLNSGNTWGISPNTSLGSGVWGGALPTTTSGGNMQTQSTSGSGENSSNSLTGSSGWGVRNGMQDNCVQGSGQSSTWQGINLPSGLDLPSNPSASPADLTSWGSSSSTSVITSSSISSPLDSKGASAIPSTIWNGDGASTGWGSSEPAKGDSGWGSPNSGIPLANAGTEAWGQPDPSKPPNVSSGWGQPSQSASTGWGQSDQQKSAGSGWGDIGNNTNKSSAGSSGWCQPDPKSTPTPSTSAVGAGWGQQTSGSTKVSPPTSVSSTSPTWGSSQGAGKTQQWGNAGGTSAQWQQQPPQSSANPNSNTGAAAGWNSAASTVNQAPRPIGSQSQSQQPAQTTTVTQVTSPPTPAAQPSSWAEAAGRGLPPAPPQSQQAFRSRASRDEMISRAVNSSEGWGKTPVRQDTNWDMEDSPKLQRKPLPTANNPNANQDAANTWNQPNDGTAIWERTKEPSAAKPGWEEPSQPQQLGPKSSTHWGNPDADGGTWEGPPDSTNTWQGHGSRANQQPPSSMTNQWGQQQPPAPARSDNMWTDDSKSHAYGGSSGPGGSDWGGNKSEEMGNSNWNKKGEDNVWDRNGTNHWGEPGVKSQMESGTWGGGTGGNRPGRSGSSSSWADEAQSSNWGGQNAPNPSSGGYDSGTSMWNDPNSGRGGQNWNAQGGSGVPPNRGTVGGSGNWNQIPPNKANWMEGQNKDDGGMWNPSGKPGWGEPWGSGGGAKPKTPSAGWGDNEWNNKQQVPVFAGMNLLNNDSRQPQMRARMLQHLTQMGFKKEDAQHALISNNMNLDSALAELLQSRQDAENDQKGRQIRPMHTTSKEDLRDPASHVGGPLDSSHFVPPLPNTPFSNAQSGQQPNPVAMTAALKSQQQLPPSLQNPNSSLAQSSINPLLQKQLSQQLNKDASQNPSLPAGRNITKSMPSLVHTQLAQQLQMAVQAKLVSPQFLNEGQLNPHQLIMLQQLLQLQTLLQRLVQQQQVIQQNKHLNPIQQRSQLDQMAVMIMKIKQQIVYQQQQIQAQCLANKPPQPAAPPQQQQPTVPSSQQSSVDPNKDLEGLGSLNISGNNASSTQNQGQSRLKDWIKESNRRAMEIAGIDASKAPGGKPPMHQSSSTPNLLSKETSSAMTNLPSLSSEGTWSANTSNVSWPNTSTSNAPADSGDSKQVSPPNTSSVSTPNSETQQGSDGESASNALDIQEFVPGKPWQGMNSKTIEDDPTLTPGSVSVFRPFNVSQPKEEQIASILGGKSSTNTSPTSDSWPNTKWSISTDNSDLGWAGQKNNARQPPGFINRSMSMPAGAQSYQKSQSTPSMWLLLKNVSPQMDSNTLETLCKMHGPLQNFVLNSSSGQALICFKTRDDVMRAQKALNQCQFGSQIITAEYISEQEAVQVARTMSSSSAAGDLSTSRGADSSLSGLWSQNTSSSSSSNKPVGGQQWNGASSNSGVWGSLWAGPSGLDEHSSFLPNDLLGGQ